MARCSPNYGRLLPVALRGTAGPATSTSPVKGRADARASSWSSGPSSANSDSNTGERPQHGLCQAQHDSRSTSPRWCALFLQPGRRRLGPRGALASSRASLTFASRASRKQCGRRFTLVRTTGEDAAVTVTISLLYITTQDGLAGSFLGTIAKRSRCSSIIGDQRVSGFWCARPRSQNDLSGTHARRARKDLYGFPQVRSNR